MPELRQAVIFPQALMMDANMAKGYDIYIIATYIMLTVSSFGYIISI